MEKLRKELNRSDFSRGTKVKEKETNKTGTVVTIHKSRVGRRNNIDVEFEDGSRKRFYPKELELI